MLAVVCSTMIAVICSSISSACLIRITRSRGLRILCRWFCGVWLIWLCWFRIRRLWICWSWICRLWIRLTLIPSTRRRYWIWCRWFGRFWIYSSTLLYFSVLSQILQKAITALLYIGISLIKVTCIPRIRYIPA